ncbi:MAG: biopolymer transporter ExbD [Chthoniobacter sp.]|nr:biopolymer transporter ExbD [Chthoniobacter sp.]
MKLTRTLKIPAWLFSLIPLVNVVFLVVIFFALSSRFVLQPGLAVSLPPSSFTLAPRDGAQIISITSAPVPTIYHHDQAVTLAELGQHLGESRTTGRSVIIKADAGTPYALVVQVTDEALRLGFSVILATGAERP